MDSEIKKLQGFRAMHRDGGHQIALETVKALHAAGITVLPGSDTPNGGRIAKGLRADLLLVKGAPDRNIRDTRNIVAVIKAGKVNYPAPALPTAVQAPVN